MKRANHLVEPIADPDNLRLAFWKASKGKRQTREVLAYGERLDDNLCLLREQILSGQVEVGEYHLFTIFEPKQRQICASAFRERVLHHAIMNICHPYFERVHIHDSYASRKGKGTYAALNRAKYFTKETGWFLKLDVRKFFASLNHSIILHQLERLFKDEKLLSIFYQIIDSFHDQPSRGMPIGNLTSQYLANHYLTGLDHYIKEHLQIKKYVRYMDDMILWHRDKESLKEAHQAIREYVRQKLQCELKPELLRRTKTGVPFLGYRTFPHHVRLSHHSKHRFIRKLRTIDHNYQHGIWDEAECQRKVLPLLAFVRHADTDEFRRQVLQQIQTQQYGQSS